MSKVIKILVYLLSSLILVAIIVPILCSLLLLLPPVQNFVVDKATSFISNKLETKIDIGRIDIKFFNRVVIEQLYVEDYQRDTLIYADKIDVAIRRIGFGIQGENMELGEVSLSDVKFYLIQRAPGESNLKQILNRLKKKEKKKSTKDFGLKAEKLTLRNLHFVHNKLEIIPREYGVNFSDLNVRDVNLTGTDISIVNDDITLRIDNISLRDKSGFSVERLASKHFNISGKGIFFNDLLIRTPGSDLNFNHLRLASGTWKNYSDFVTKVKLDAELVRSDVSFASIAYFAPSLRTWKTTLSDVTMNISGPIAAMRGTVINANSLNTKLALNYSVKGIPNIARTIFDFDIKRIQTSAEDINAILSDITQRPFLAENKILANLHQVNVTGKFTGRITDFFAQANVSTEYGTIAIGGNFAKTQSGANSIKGSVDSHKFNVGSLLQVAKLGDVALKAKVNGDFGGNTKMSLKSDGEITTLTYNGYTYRDIKMNGVMSDRTFTGNLSSTDENLEFNFDGILNFSDEVPSYDFDLKLQNANFAKLNLNKRDSVSQLKCRIIADFSGTSLNNVNGRAEVRDLEYVNHIDQVKTGDIVLTGRNSADSKYLALNSSFADLEFRSRMSYDTLVSYIRNTLDLYLPTLRKEPMQYVASEKKSVLDVNDYSLLRLNIKQANNLSSIFLPGLLLATGTQLSLMINPQAEQISVSAKSDYIEYDNFFVSALDVNTRNQGDSLALYVGAEDVYAGGMYMPNFSIIGGAKSNTVNLSTRFADQERGSEVLLGVTAALERNARSGAPQVKINIKPSYMSNRKQTWRIMARSIIYDTAQITVNNFRIICKGQELRVNGVASRSLQDTLSLSLSHFDLEPLSQLVARMGYSISGYTSGKAKMASVLKQGLLSAGITFDSIKINGLPMPPTKFESKWDFQRERAGMMLSRLDVPDTLITAYYRPTDKRYRVDVNLKSVDLSLLDPLLSGVISSTKGTADMKVQVLGQQSNISYNGDIMIPEFTTKVDFTNVPYTLKNGHIKVVDGKLELQPVKLHDPMGNSADFDLMLDLGNLANMKYQLKIKPENLLVLNTNDNLNPMFYGRVFASGLASITGDKRGVNMDIVATTAKNSQFFLPLSGKSNASRANFIVFEDTKKQEIDTTDILQRKKMMFQRTQNQAVKSNSNLNINMAINVQPNTELQVVIDPTVGDIIKAKGNGTINMRVNPTNNIFTMYGDYEITEGSYLFTLQNVINKKFVIESGSTIKWTGDPIDALLNIVAIYKLKTSLAPLDPEMRGSVPVECEVMLSDRLSHPTVTFGVKVPNAEPEVQSLVSNLLNTQEMMATQFFWLLAVNSFYADGNSSGNGNIGAIGGSATGFEFLSNQISNWISSDKFNIGIRYRPKSELTSEEVNVDFSTQLFSNRLLLEVEGNYDAGNNPMMANKTVNNVTGDFYLTWLIDRAGNLKAKVFSRTIDSFDENQGLQENGIGIYYKENFNTFKDIINNLRERFSSEGREQKKQQREQKRQQKEDSAEAVKPEEPNSQAE